MGPAQSNFKYASVAKIYVDHAQKSQPDKYQQNTQIGPQKDVVFKKLELIIAGTT